MENNAKVFSSGITRADSNQKNELYELLHKIPATPIKLIDTKTHTCDFRPKTGKYYIPKKKTRLKVKTVRDIRISFEQDIYSHLITDLEAQESAVFDKIRQGSSTDDNTKSLATKILRGDAPISRSTWQMLLNLNPENHEYPRQFVLWNGKYIQVNGSLGGMKTNICNYDLASKPQGVPSKNHNKKKFKQQKGNGKKRLLRNSLSINFKPGPLCKKQFLDNSHQRYHVGNIELVNLPKPGLDVQPKYGTTFEPSITNFLNSMRADDGTISQKWAELSVSVLGRVEKSKAVQLNRDSVTFDLTYKYNQNRLLMRRDVEHCMNASELISTPQIPVNHGAVEINVQFEIEEMLNKIIDAVEINLIQDELFTKDQELKNVPCEDLNSVNVVTHMKEKSKRKFGELDRLDVRVITLPVTEKGNLTRSCSKMHCSFGCICACLEGTYNLKQHCGRVDCMFDCKCEFSKYENDLSYKECTDTLPELLSIDDEINLNLAKEEQKFHQTVIVTGEKRILLKGERRNWKTSKKYADFHNNISLKQENQKTQNFSVVALKLNCDHIEPWCMIHKLYKCFCKGKFTYTSVSNECVGKEPMSKDSITNVDCLESSKVTNNADSVVESAIREFEKKIKISGNSDSRTNRIHTSRSMDKTLSTSKIIENQNYSDPVDEIQMNSISVTDKGTVLRGSSVSEITNLNPEKGMLTRHAVRKLNIRQNSHSDQNHENMSDSNSGVYLDFWDRKSKSSSRTRGYEGRKYSNGYYNNTNYKILTMEKNDKRLQQRLAFLYGKGYEESIVIKSTRNTKSDTADLVQLLVDTDKNGSHLLQPKKKDISPDTSLAAWLESHFKMHRQQMDTGLLKKSLEPPRHGQVALHSWDFILCRYREKKNLFLVSTQLPHRIFMAVNTANPFFKSCMDINDIRFADLQKYPQTVKNLLSNAKDLKDNFCILRGLPFCWELVGTVSKVNECDKHAEEENTTEMQLESSDMDTSSDSVGRKSVVENIEQKDMDTLDVFDDQDNSEVTHLVFENTEHPETITVLNHNLEIRDSLVENTEQEDFQNKKGSNQNKLEVKSLLENMEQEDLQSITEKKIASNTRCSDEIGSSKWFVMTIENDFSEIRFFRKGFFVKYGSIINAISVARLSGKTVRLSSKKCVEKPENPQFGIYAIPNDNEHTVFVGPYEMEDTLGIETIKTILSVRTLKRTRGFWITTNKIDNLKVVENPLLFVPLPNNRTNNVFIPLEPHFYSNNELSKDQQENNELQESPPTKKAEESIECSPSKTGQKIVKPITIRKTNGFYHLASDGVLKKISVQYPQSATKTVLIKKRLNMEDKSVKSLLKPIAISTDLNRSPIPDTLKEPYAEASSSAASQIKISAVYSTRDDNSPVRPSHEKGMFILNPEEINRKVVQNKNPEIKLTSKDEYNKNNDEKKNHDELSTDISGVENVEETGEEHQSVYTDSTTLKDDICVISDDENCKTSETTADNGNVWADVWIECTNIPKLGWIAGIKNLNNYLSFKIPGCEYSEFYSETEAFTKINLELRKRINSINDLEIKWTVHESIAQVRGREIDPEHLYPDYILTPEGLLHTSETIKSIKGKTNLKTYSKKDMKGCGGK